MVHKLADFYAGGVLHVANIQSVIITAASIKQQITAMGGNDVEFGEINDIVEKARTGVLCFTEAILNIEAVRDRKHGDGGHGLR